ncbi:pro-sigmaK processing inhibitor BofA family protein [Hazenella coriacea]|uniref:Inhibitor of the pro-sigma K processing machinery n=1 Tax=Hazenella coriacea TaxID=1179467 RepID=A0A4R3LAX3_9BACL|nr:pro-sigmaK processing inhibitor BofA family protein [Hazenella coriacea]TCS95434.1 inhibitor of the pro-sigma K processing machinery [Hazenella coriacea]
MIELKWWLIAVGAGIIFFMMLNRSIKKPLKWIWMGLLYSAIGALVLFIVNLLGQVMDFHIPINPVTAMITGLLGLPGILYLVAVQLLFLA